jgi:hypothetical protein
MCGGAACLPTTYCGASATPYCPLFCISPPLLLLLLHSPPPSSLPPTPPLLAVAVALPPPVPPIYPRRSHNVVTPPSTPCPRPHTHTTIPQTPLHSTPLQTLPKFSSPQLRIGHSTTPRITNQPINYTPRLSTGRSACDCASSLTFPESTTVNLCAPRVPEAHRRAGEPGSRLVRDPREQDLGLIPPAPTVSRSGLLSYQV